MVLVKLNILIIEMSVVLSSRTSESNLLNLFCENKLLGRQGLLDNPHPHFRFQNYISLRLFYWNMWIILFNSFCINDDIFLASIFQIMIGPSTPFINVLFANIVEGSGSCTAILVYANKLFNESKTASENRASSIRCSFAQSLNSPNGTMPTIT